MEQLNKIVQENKGNKSVMDNAVIIRTSLKELYKDADIITSIFELIAEHLNYISINYDDATFTIEIKIRKTAMKSSPLFEHTTSFYYGIFGKVFYDFIENNLDIIYDIITAGHPEKSLSRYDIISNINLLFEIFTVSDNLIYLKL